mmetsp:Transcript_18559/g.44707  ORF Transcript_18559/g.44707 Transcript_18559/m.44707 type:complete len:107 (-) Transcript_18559:390-710(-)
MAPRCGASTSSQDPTTASTASRLRHTPQYFLSALPYDENGAVSRHIADRQQDGKQDGVTLNTGRQTQPSTVTHDTPSSAARPSALPSLPRVSDQSCDVMDRPACCW